MKNKRLFLILTSAAILLSVPFFVMQFTNAVDWDAVDFAVMGVLLFGVGLLSELVLRKVKLLRHRVIICGAIIFAFFVIWAELAVGIFGSPIAGS
ncbi:hypothetical protein [Lunatibacter salilacus]|uniref:hypothetical protein n=1 Tax=Lunatibacter salilacus TaxID=2483804 RepID=UPI00131E1A13|nr:hypothetical protein [Lunatibacter salilacus]